MRFLKSGLHSSWFLFWTLMMALLLFSFNKYQGLRNKNERMAREIESVKAENRALAGKVDRLKTDPAYADKVARQKLGIAEKGEIIYRILPREERR